MIALAAVLVGCDVAVTPRGVVGLECKLGGDLLEGILRVGKSELVAKKGGFGGPSVCRCGSSDGVERGFNVLLGLLHQVRDVEHGFGPAAGQRQRKVGIKQTQITVCASLRDRKCPCWSACRGP